MIRLTSIARAQSKPRKRADTRALANIRRLLHAQLEAEVMADAVAEAMFKQKQHAVESEHFRTHGETWN